jgi:hypothetical protein
MKFDSPGEFYLFFWGGVSLLRQAYEQIGMKHFFETHTARLEQTGPSDPFHLTKPQPMMKI